MADPKLELLQKVPLFAGLRRGDLERVAALVDEVDVPGDVELTHEGRVGHEFFVIVEGRVRVEREGRVIGTLGRGDFLGEIALIDGRPRSASVITEAPTRLLVMAHREFDSLLDSYPAVQNQVLRALADRVRRSEPDLPQ